MHRRHFLASLGLAAIPSLRAADKADFTLHIAPASFEIAPRKIVKTIAYNGSVPGPLLRMKEGQTVTIEVFNDTGDAELVHWHGLQIPSAVDGSMEEGTPMLPARSSARYTFTPKPSGTRWYHTHVMAGRNLKRATYTGQFGFFTSSRAANLAITIRRFFSRSRNGNRICPAEAGRRFASMWLTTFSRSTIARWGTASRSASKPGQRVLLRILNASATMTAPHRRRGAQVSCGGDGRESGRDSQGSASAGDWGQPSASTPSSK